jgi:hypothetical protein
MLFRDLKDFSEMRIIEDGSAWIGRIVDDDGTRCIIDQGFQV